MRKLNVRILKEPGVRGERNFKWWRLFTRDSCFHNAVLVVFGGLVG